MCPGDGRAEALHQNELTNKELIYHIIIMKIVITNHSIMIQVTMTQYIIIIYYKVMIVMTNPR